MARRRSAKPGEGQGGFLEAPVEVPAGKELIEVDGMQYIHEISPSTSLADYYRTIAYAVKAIGRARSNKKGFTQLPDSSEPVKEFSARLDTGDPDETRRIVGETDKKHRFKAQDRLNKQNKAEYNAIKRYARVTNEFTVEEINDRIILPPAIDELEMHYFYDPQKTDKELSAMRRQLHDRAVYYAQLEEQQAAQEGHAAA